MRGRQELGTALNSLYESYNREESASDPVNLVRPFRRNDDREIAGFCAAALAFGRVGSVLNSIRTLFRIMGPHPAEFVRAFDPDAPHPELREMVHRWTKGVDLVALLWILRQMVEAKGSVEDFFVEGYSTDDDDVSAALDSFSDESAGARYQARLQTGAETSRGLLLLSASLQRERLQASEPVSPLDGPFR